MAERDVKPDEPEAKRAPRVTADEDPLAPALAAVERGDLVEAKRVARELSAREGIDPAVRVRADNLLAQLAPDRVTIAVMIATGVLGVVLYLVYHHR